ncbi:MULTISPECIES: ATP-binding protein [unclassified Pseudoalteromonas]|uniref:ATP-binding protein n=1 Tax=unclassified Pseudoalteromonas TaxID=194690 RepID=UPI00073191D3|nr:MULTISPECIES: ATP-binding protein [unclassified Pseudoalteromonas]KTD96623.1 hybrid sensor histidine kinase/response regulator [Pseudoalteromonas sp. H71]MBW4967822.1 response regulator [Pseudoalteromonas sp. CR1]TMN77578.1 hybrid sensor histidine kinase/response regulator [Pseudoalteromonas sp. S410]TMN90936.1 hybrid sensor histidine kinase/response regulator [Pseudoalteromonas sp. S408]TMN94915.1 hybrid sensor histidine kinase/response regulator [Pseudoalteromonas sp. S407]|tara:strand:- start:2079 stop:4235 length:2157 start_codon:yes stop_codon:yes gene_type:complete
MLDSYTLYFASIAVIVVMIFLNILTWRTNKQIPGTLLYIFYPVLMLCAVIAFAFMSNTHNLIVINAACSLMFAASIVHCFSISQFLNYRGPGFKLLCSVTAFSAVVFGYYSFFDPSLAGRVIASDLQHISEALFLLFIFIKYARKPYPNGSIVYITILTLVVLAFIARSIFMNEIEQKDLVSSSWFSTVLFLNGTIAPMFYAAGMALLCNERREHHLNTLAAKAQKDLEIRGLFLSTISHEIRTPLNGILGSAQLVMNQTSDTHSKAYCEAIINSAESLNLLVDKVLEYASLDQSDEALYEEDIEFKTWLNNLCLLLSPLAEQKQLKFELVCNVPEQACYYCDQQKLRQIIINLVGNAIKFTDRGVVKIQVDLILEKQLEHTIKVSVKDSGPGIENDEIAYLTEPYVQSSAGKEKGGTGLGLAITSRLLEKLGSRLEISSELGIGSVFSFITTFTLGELSLVEQRHQTKDYLTGLDVLLVEDLDLNQKIAIEFMADDEHKIKLAKDGKSAIELMQAYHFDVVLLDMNLPDLTGQEVIKRLKRVEHKNQRTPILAFTASLSPDEVKEYLALGIKDIVGKPIKHQKLRQALSDSQSNQTTNIAVELIDTLYDKTAIETLASSFSEDEVSSIYNEFVLSARNKLIRCQGLIDQHPEQCIKLLHRQASTALQLGFNRYGMELKKIERRLLDNKPHNDLLNEALELWQRSLEKYLKFVRGQLS